MLGEAATRVEVIRNTSRAAEAQASVDPENGVIYPDLFALQAGRALGPVYSSLRGAGISARDKTALFMLAWDLCGSEFGARHELYEMSPVGGPAMKLAASMTLMPSRRLATQHPAPREVRHERAGPEGPRLGVLAVHDLVDQRADLRCCDLHHVADLVGEAAPGRAAVVQRREHRPDVEHDAVRILVRAAVKLRREVGEIAPDLADVRRVLDAEAVEALHGRLEADPPRGIERERLVQQSDEWPD